MPKPIIFLAFANDRVDYSRYLRNLPIEQRQIREALESAQAAGLCEIVERNNASLPDILDTFQKYQDRVAIFHYGGHADGYQLLLETPTGEHSVAHGGGLVSFFARQKGLKLIFLNGCSTQQQSLELIQNGIPAVIGTSNSINDEVATSLSVRFYRGLAKGLSLERTWNEALDAAKMEKGNDLKAFYRSKKELEVDAFPWNFHVREGAEIVKQWNLPDEVQNPLFGLPELSQKYNLPDRPFRFLGRYESEHAELFYGRSAYIRELYNRCTDQSSAPVILFIGQSGSGKSSLLDAGLLPRLEHVARVIYLRRNSELGLLGTLKAALGITEKASTAENQGTETAHSEVEKMKKIEEEERLEQIKQVEKLKESIPLKVIHFFDQALDFLRQGAKTSNKTTGQDGRQDHIQKIWQAEEQDKPLIIILDQVEECFTRPNESLKEELKVFLEEIKKIFNSPQDKPKGKLILSYRKEYSSEIEEAMKNLEIPREKIFLQHLDKQGIEEIVFSLNKTERLKRKYRLSIDTTLPEIIADDLLEHKDSAIAPMLQILLTKMWNLETGEGKDKGFTLEKYQKLKKGGILLDNFFEEQIGKLCAEDKTKLYEEFEKTGLILDMLNFHTTDLGTAETRSLKEIEDRYGKDAKRWGQVQELLKKFNDLYLLIKPTNERTGLAHDTLAPLVKQRFKQSNRMGQRALLSLENKMQPILVFENTMLADLLLKKKKEAEKNGKNVDLSLDKKDLDKIAEVVSGEIDKSLLDKDDLRVVENGKMGMRDWTDKEVILIQKSQAKRARERRKSKLIRITGAFALIIILITAVFAFFEREKAKKQALIAEEQTQKATENLNKANKLIDAFYFAYGKFALAYGLDPAHASNTFYFIDKNGNAIDKLGKWNKIIDQFDESIGFARVEGGEEEYLLDTLGNIYPFAENIPDVLNPEIKAFNLSYQETKEPFPSKILENTQLQVLILNGKTIKFLPLGISKMVNLQNLILANNEINTLPNEIGKLKNLAYLDLQSNQLTSLPNQIGELDSLKVLYLFKNQLSNLPAEIGKLTKLSYLNLSENTLKNLPNEIGGLTKLTFLNLSNNQLVALPNEIGKLTKFTDLSLESNQLSVLPKEFGNLVHLEALNLYANSLKSLPQEFGKLKKLSTLDLTANKDLDWKNAVELFSKMPQKVEFMVESMEQIISKESEFGILKVFIDENQFPQLIPFAKPTQMERFKDMIYLNWQNKGIRSLTGVSALVNITRLMADKNEISILPAEIGKLKRLSDLGLGINKLKTLPAEIGELDSLKRLWLFENQLVALPAEIGKLESLESLDLSVNLLKTLPDEIADLKKLQSLNLRHNDELDWTKTLSVLAKMPQKFVFVLSGVEGTKNQDSTALRVNIDGKQFLKLLTIAPDKVAEIKNAHYLDFSRSQFKALPKELFELKNLDTLNLEANQLSTLPAEFANLKKLKYVILESNPLVYLPKSLESFLKDKTDLSPEKLDELFNPEKRQSFSLFGWGLSVLPADIILLKNLTELDLTDNQFKTLPKEILELKNLKKLVLTNNPISKTEQEKSRKLLPNCEISF